MRLVSALGAAAAKRSDKIKVRQALHFIQYFTSSIQIKRKGEYLYGTGPCLAALQAGRRRVYGVYWGEPERAPYGIEKRPPRTIYLAMYAYVFP